MVKLDMTQALDEPNQKFDFGFSVPLDFSEETVAPHQITGEASVALTYFSDNDGIVHLGGNVRVPCRFICDRCGAVFEKYLFLEIDETLSPSLDEEEELSYDEPVVELDEIISSIVLINFPSKVLCNDDCKGLCSKCGKNLNEGACECSQTKVGKNNPFADLFNSKKLGGN